MIKEKHTEFKNSWYISATHLDEEKGLHVPGVS